MNNFSPRKSPSNPHEVGLTLVEVTIALGLVAFALVAILGVLPTGLNQLRDAMDRTVEAQIVNFVGNQALVTPFDEIRTGRTLYFDEEGLPGGSDGAFYRVSVTNLPPSFPGSAAGWEMNLTRLRIEITMPTRPGQTSVRSIQVANHGR